MALQTLPPFFNMQYTNANGQLAQDGLLYNDLTFQILNAIVKYFNTGLAAPQLTTTQITAYASDATIPIGAIFFNTNLAKLQVKVANASIETITSS